MGPLRMQSRKSLIIIIFEKWRSQIIFSFSSSEILILRPSQQLRNGIADAVLKEIDVAELMLHTVLKKAIKETEFKDPAPQARPSIHPSIHSSLFLLILMVNIANINFYYFRVTTLFTFFGLSFIVKP